MRHLMVSLSSLASISKERKIASSKFLSFEPQSWKNVSSSDASLYFDSSFSCSVVKRDEIHRKKEVVVLSDDEPENVASMEVVASCCTNSGSRMLSDTSFPATGMGGLSDVHSESMITSSKYDILEPFPSGIFVEDDRCSSLEEDNVVIDKSSFNCALVARSNEGSHMQGRVHGKGVNKALRSSSIINSSHNAPNVQPQNCQSLSEVLPTKIFKTDPHTKKEIAMIKHLVRDDIDDPLDFALDHTSHSKQAVSKPTVLAPKRKVIQLQMPTNNISLNRMDISSRRLRPPRLDVWYRSILEMDYFIVMGIYSADGDGDEKTTSNLNKVPLHFQSSDHYVKVFQPLILEEFKAQLQKSFLESSLEHMHCGSLFIVSVERIDDFHIIRGRPDEKGSATSLSCVENDLVLLTKEPLENSIQSTHVLGKVKFHCYILFLLYFIC